MKELKKGIPKLKYKQDREPEADLQLVRRLQLLRRKENPLQVQQHLLRKEAIGERQVSSHEHRVLVEGLRAKGLKVPLLLVKLRLLRESPRRKLHRSSSSDFKMIDTLW